jgi:hypothetical protein
MGTRSRKTPTYTQESINTDNKPRVGFEPMTPVFERAKTVRALDRSAWDRHKACNIQKKRQIRTIL